MKRDTYRERRSGEGVRAIYVMFAPFWRSISGSIRCSYDRREVVVGMVAQCAARVRFIVDAEIFSGIFYIFAYLRRCHRRAMSLVYVSRLCSRSSSMTSSPDANFPRKLYPRYPKYLRAWSMRVPCLTSLPLRMRVTRHNMAVGAGATPVLLLFSSRFSTRARFVDRVNPCANLFTIELCVAQIPTESCRSAGVEDLFSREMNPRLNPRRNVATINGHRRSEFWIEFHVSHRGTHRIHNLEHAYYLHDDRRECRKRRCSKKVSGNNTCSRRHRVRRRFFCDISGEDEKGKLSR